MPCPIVRTYWLTRVYVFIVVPRTVVTGRRVAIFLKTCVVGRAHKQRGKGPATGQGKGKKKAPVNNASAVEQILGPEKEAPIVGAKTIEGYLCALCHLQKRQMSVSGQVLNSPRRHAGVIDLLATLRRNTAVQRKSSTTDRCKGLFFQK